MLAQLRIGILPLHVETGRYSNTKLEDRICKICNTGHIENEYHFLFHCTYYDDERNDFMVTIDVDLTQTTDKEKLCYLFEHYTRKLAKYICNIFTKRQEKLYEDIH